jgi:hypothetical protein
MLVTLKPKQEKVEPVGLFLRFMRLPKCYRERRYAYHERREAYHNPREAYPAIRVHVHPDHDSQETSELKVELLDGWFLFRSHRTGGRGRMACPCA